ncbi:Isoleucyl-tRNA synthetase [Shouchella lonarensis]|uniref:Isoleucine--tRNA ligase n=2 Tax=Shouchella lonarensis TaxID=1464122 RepID=A0A1G6KY97_9BACI|nr:Isoleucyl-tRNA synthetase [Shouchella lonarensis]
MRVVPREKLLVPFRDEGFFVFNEIWKRGDEMDYKHTLLMPKTAFPMRGNLPNSEPKRQEKWREIDMYKQVQARTEGRPLFILHGGPPYANGDLHMGHALTQTLKDFIVRYKSMTGFQAPFVPGWDTHGLPIETALTKNKKVDRKKMSTKAFRERCEAYAWTQIERQREQFMRLGALGDWFNPYVTLDKSFEARQIQVFGEMACKGYIYKGKKPVYWSPSSESALAEAEIEYHDKRSPSIYVSFQVMDGKGVLSEDDAFVIWTTTPWTLPANLGITVHADLDYSVVAVDGRSYVVASGLLDTLKKELSWEDATVTKTVKGSALEYITAKHPFYERTALVMNGEHVTLDAGTGCVHTAPGHGEDDFVVGQKYGLDVLCPVDEKGVMTEEAPGFTGEFYDNINKQVAEKLTENGSLLKLSFMTHSYPHDWRTKKPVIFRATAQWFASIEKIRGQLLQAIKDTNWFPEWGETRLANMMRDRGDWCISRQRVWGVPIPVFYGEDGQEIITEETIAHVAQLFREHGSGVWFEREAKDLLPPDFTSPHSPNGHFTKETDIMDVWFDSGSSHEAVLKEREDLTFPADVYFEGSDQYRGWFNSSLSTSVAINGVAPYKTVLSHGFTMDGEGRKMSKSLGNVISLADATKQLGADIVRLWVASSDYRADVRVSKDILQQVAEAYRKIRNTFRFLLGNLHDFNPEVDRIAPSELSGVHQFMYVSLQELIEKVRQGYDEYQFVTVYNEFRNFCTVTLSAFYMDIAKDTLYIAPANDPERRAFQTVMYEAVVTLSKLIAPILPHTAEEVWENIPGVAQASVQLTDMPTAEQQQNVAGLKAEWHRLMNVRDDVLKALEEARNEKVIGKSLQASLTLYPTGEVRELLGRTADLQKLFIVSEVEVAGSEQIVPEAAHQFEQLTVLVKKAAGETCARCWQVNTTVGTVAKHEALCASCAETVEKWC